MAGFVFDVSGSDGRKFYGQGGRYHAFAGRSCTRAVVLPSLQEQDINDDTSDFDVTQQERMRDWMKHYQNKYKQVGVLKADISSIDSRNSSGSSNCTGFKGAAETCSDIVSGAETTVAAHLTRSAEDAVERNNQQTFTVVELAAYDGSDLSKPLLLGAFIER